MEKRRRTMIILSLPLLPGLRLSAFARLLGPCPASSAFLLRRPPARSGPASGASSVFVLREILAENLVIDFLVDYPAEVRGRRDRSAIRKAAFPPVLLCSQWKKTARIDKKTARRLRAIAAIERRFGFVRKQTSSDSAI